MGHTEGVIIDPVRLEIQSRIDLCPGFGEPFDVAAWFDNDADAFAWCNENYVSNPPWRNPARRLPEGHYLVDVTVLWAGGKTEGRFLLTNRPSQGTFRLESYREPEPSRSGQEVTVAS
jgi:hypothetical protein